MNINYNDVLRAVQKYGIDGTKERILRSRMSDVNKATAMAYYLDITYFLLKGEHLK